MEQIEGCEVTGGPFRAALKDGHTVVHPHCHDDRPDRSKARKRLVHLQPFVHLQTIAPRSHLPRSALLGVTILRSGLEVLHHNFLEGSSIASLHLMQNQLSRISSKAFGGLENILTTLDLSFNQLDDSILVALSPLGSLQWINLKGNHLEEVHPSKWSQMNSKNVINSLFLSSNHITHIPEGAFAILSNLVLLDVEGNLIHDVDSHSFPISLQSLSLSNNILKKVPLHAIYNLKNLRYLYMSGNLFRKLPSPFHLQTPRLEKLEISNNMLTQISEFVFNGSFTIKELHLDFNFIRTLSARSFKGTALERLVLANNRISSLHSDAFVGIETTLKTLDLSFNLLEEFPSAVNNLNTLFYLSLKGNMLQTLEKDDLIGFRRTLEILDLSGNLLERVPQMTLLRMKKLVRLSLQDNRIRKIQPEDFEVWGETLTTLSLANNGITHLSEGSFAHLKRLKELKLSFNNILFFSSEIFKPLEKTLEVLDLSSSLFSQNQSIELLWKNLKNLEWLQLDHNNVSKVSSLGLSSLLKIRHMDFSYNDIKEIPIDFFMSSKNVYLSTINLANNELKIIKSGTFWEIPHVSTIVLFGNKISNIEDYGFAHCTYLHTIVLSKNNLTAIAASAIYNITRLSNLFLQDNLLTVFSLDSIEGDTSQLYINLSNNALRELKPGDNNVTTYLKIRTLDLTNNQISVISNQFMASISNHLVYLFLSKNQIENVSFPLLPVLQMLDLSCNKLLKLDSEDFECCPNVQILMLQHNTISDILDGALDGLQNLRILDLSQNNLSSLREDMFSATKLERLNLSGNHLLKIPSSALNKVHRTLRNLDLSFNELNNLSLVNFTSLSKLQALNLSSNRISFLDGESFFSLTHLLELDLSHNPLKIIKEEFSLHVLQNLKSFLVSNSSLSVLETLQLPQLHVISLRNNFLFNISQQALQSCNQVRHLDLSGNFLQDVPLHLWPNMKHLISLDISCNPIEVLGVNSFSGLDRLQSLDISGLLLKRLDPRTLHGLRFLITLKTDSYASVRSFRLQDLLSQAPALRKATVNVEESTLSHQVQRAFGTKLRELVITGSNLRTILPDAFAGLTTHELTIRISGTLVSKFPDGLLRYLPDVRYLTLDLRHNRLTTMDPGVLAAVTRDGPVAYQTQHITGGVLLEENPWSCSCELLWLGRWLRRWLRETFHVHMLSVEASLYVNSVSRKATCTVSGTNVSLAIIDLRKSDVDCNPVVSAATRSLLTVGVFPFLLLACSVL
ncbi:chaoptin [Caerostris darwini]|uniref:Chaoptin n=1 Tax=Caerostris darwini TaxID=1538125 RepID=A0AAV4UTQ1_9ARAC|nr:chaoptin [Caerostris darwini]